MRIAVARQDLSKLLSAVDRVVDTRNAVPILSNVVLTAADGVLTARGTDLNIEVTTTTTYTGEPGTACVPSRSLLDIVKRVVGDTVSLELDPGVVEGTGTLVVKSGRSRFKLPSIPSRSFPTLAVAEYEHEFNLNLGELFAPVMLCLAIGEDDRPYLEGVYLHQVGDKLRAVGADGPRVVVYAVDTPDGADGVSAIVPRKVADIASSFKAAIDISLCDKRIRLRAPDIDVCAKLIEGKYAMYERVIPADRERVLTVNKAELAAAANRVGVVASEAKGKAVRLGIAPGSIVLTAEDKDGREAVDEIAAEYAGEPTFLAFNVRYLDEMLSSVPGDDVIFDLTDNTTTTRVRSKSDANFVGVLSPFRMAA